MQHNMYIVIVCQPSCDIMNLEVNLNFLMKLFSLYDMTKKWWQKLKYLENEKRF